MSCKDRGGSRDITWEEAKSRFWSLLANLQVERANVAYLRGGWGGGCDHKKINHKEITLKVLLLIVAFNFNL